MNPPHWPAGTFPPAWLTGILFLDGTVERLTGDGFATCQGCRTQASLGERTGRPAGVSCYRVDLRWLCDDAGSRHQRQTLCRHCLTSLRGYDLEGQLVGLMAGADRQAFPPAWVEILACGCRSSHEGQTALDWGGRLLVHGEPWQVDRQGEAVWRFHGFCWHPFCVVPAATPAIEEG